MHTSVKVSSKIEDRLAGMAEYSKALEGPSRNRNSFGRPGMVFILSQWNGKVRSPFSSPMSAEAPVGDAAQKGHHSQRKGSREASIH